MTQLSHASISTFLGPLFAVEGHAGLRFVAFVKLSAGLKQLPPHLGRSESSRSDSDLKTRLSKWMDQYQTTGKLPAVKLDPRGTDFQRKIWKAMRGIASGKTKSYKDLAIQSGHPGAVRAVGGACASNPIALFNPCHRVIRQDRGLGGFEWGTPLKKQILAHEKKFSGGKIKKK